MNKQLLIDAAERAVGLAIGAAITAYLVDHDWRKAAGAFVAALGASAAKSYLASKRGDKTSASPVK